MATKLNIAKETRKAYKRLDERYKEAIVATNVSDGSIAIYYADKMEEVKEEIGEAKGSIKNMLKMLEKNSNKRENYEKMDAELEEMYSKIKKSNSVC